MTARQAKIKALQIGATLLNQPHDRDAKTEFYCKELAKELTRRANSLEATEQREAKKKSFQKA